MYVVVEFEERTCAVVPLNWLCDNQQTCYWPKTSTSSYQLEKMVRASKQPMNSWSKYPIKKIIQITDDYESANKVLQRAIDESSSSDGAGTSVQPLTMRTIEKRNEAESEDKDQVQNNNDDARKIDKKPNDSSCLDSSESYLSDFTDDENFENIATPKSRVSESSSVPSPAPSTSDVIPLTPSTSSSLNATNTSARINSNTNYLLENVLRKIEHVANVQSQQTLILNHILNTNQSASASSLNKPSDLPSLPVNNKPEYKALEMFLQNEEKYNYLKCRLACIGGTGVRNACMNMMKFILSDKVAMKFNWAGRDQRKRAFKETQMSKVIQDAIMCAFSKHGDRADLTDKNIQDAMKDWLKLARHRFENKAKKMRLN